MANTTFTGPVRSQNGFQTVSINSTTGAVTVTSSTGDTNVLGNTAMFHRVMIHRCVTAMSVLGSVLVHMSETAMRFMHLMLAVFHVTAMFVASYVFMDRLGTATH